MRRAMHTMEPEDRRTGIAPGSPRKLTTNDTVRATGHKCLDFTYYHKEFVEF